MVDKHDVLICFSLKPGLSRGAHKGLPEVNHEFLSG